jgi:hypothetical protein
MNKSAPRLSRRSEPLHDPLSSPCWLMRIFRPIIQPLVLAMFNLETHFLSRRAMGAKLVGDHDASRPWRSSSRARA